MNEDYEDDSAIYLGARLCSGEDGPVMAVTLRVFGSVRHMTAAQAEEVARGLMEWSAFALISMGEMGPHLAELARMPAEGVA